MKTLITIVITVALIAGMVGCGGDGAEEPVYFPDADLEEAIREEIGKPTGDIYPSDLAEPLDLNASSRNISDLTGLEHCASLRWLFLNDNQISDISPLTNLTDLIVLDLDSNQISDISPLVNLTGLATLRLDSNQISNISPLVNLTGLLHLDLDSNQISDISPLVNLTGLLNLYLDSNQISDISPLANLTSLVYINFNDNQISDISPLVENEGLSEGDEVRLYENPLSSASINTYIPQLEARGVTVVY